MSNLIVEPYTEKSIVVRGETKEHREQLKALGGKFNMNLRDGAGWIFSKAKSEKAVRDYVEKGIESKVEYIESGNSSSNNQLFREIISLKKLVLSLKSDIQSLKKSLEEESSSSEEDISDSDSEEEGFPKKRLIKRKS